MSEQEKNYIGNVIRIIDKRTLLVDAGSAQLAVGDHIQIIEVGPEIKNLNGEYLCNYEFVKDSLEVIQTSDLYSVCKKMDYEPVKSPLAQLSLSPLLSSQIQYVPLHVEESDIDALEIQDPYIRVGDRIKRIP